MISRRLPGFSFEVQSTSLDTNLPRMDIAAFIGFTASGPINVPVAIESIEQFTAVFGSDAPLAWDAQQGIQRYAYLAPCVRAFFRNGGVRCWIIRVTDHETAVTNQYAISGLLSVSADNTPDSYDVQPALLNARSPGSWSDNLRVSAHITGQSLPVLTVSADRITMSESVASYVRVGDVLRIKDDNEVGEAYFAISAVQIVRDGSPPGSVLQLSGMSITFETIESGSPILSLIVDTIQTADSHNITPLSALEIGEDNLAFLDVQSSLTTAPPIGSWLRLTTGSVNIWLRVEDIGDSKTNPDGVQISGSAQWQRDATINISTWAQPEIERLRLSLTVEVINGDIQWLTDLSLASGDRFYGNLPADDTVYQAIFDGDSLSPIQRLATQPRFPLAFAQPDMTFAVPLRLTSIPEYPVSAFTTTQTALERDGLADFNVTLFLDDALTDAYSTNLMNRADFIRYQSRNPRALTGIHAVLALDEVTIIAVPDASQPGWQSVTPALADAPMPQPPIARPEWWRWQNEFCASDTNDVPLTTEPAWENFINCSIEIITAPTISSSAIDSAGTFTLFWESSPPNPDATYILQEATLPDFSDAVTLYEGTDESITIYGRSIGDYYYHVRAIVGTNTSEWGDGIVVQVFASANWAMNTVADDSAIAVLTDVQRALLRMCAASGEIFAILTLPQHYRADDAIDHITALQPGSLTQNTFFITPALTFGEIATLSYGAIYHPWLVIQDNTLRTTPPSGAISGIFARRAIERGAWVAPANEAIPGVVALEPSIHEEHWLNLQTAQINLVRNEPYGVVVLNADTLSTDEGWRSLNVRRLVILIRRLALELGVNYVFEPFDGVFRRLVERAFERRLAEMFQLGAFRGRITSESYRVRVVSTPNDMYNGRFIVEIQFAPSLPLTFVTVRLVQSGHQSEVTEEIAHV